MTTLRRSPLLYGAAAITILLTGCTSGLGDSSVGISAEEAEELGVYAADGDALVEDIYQHEGTLIILVRNVSEAPDTYTVEVEADSGEASQTEEILIPAEASRHITVPVEDLPAGRLTITLAGELLGVVAVEQYTID